MLEALLEDTKIKARAANKQALEILGVSRGIYKQFPNIAKMFLIKPLVVRNLSCHLNLGAQFNFKTGLIPQAVKQGTDVKKINFSELHDIQIQLQFQDVLNVTLQRTIEDPEYLQLLKKEPPHKQCGIKRVSPHTLHLAQVVQQENRQRTSFN